MSTHTQFLLQTLAEAALRRGFCAPNPAVGAVVVKEGQVIATGTHWLCGAPHAERNALAKISHEQAQGATLYVSLEPCVHQGRTPPCTDIIIERGIKAVVYGYQDPNPLVAGQGADVLRAAGIECICKPLPEITQFYQSYQYWTETGRPWVTAKIAVSLDGRIAAPGGAPVAITGEALKRATFAWRLKSDAILTTAQTVIQDNPRLDVRLDEVIAKSLYILDRRGRLTGSERVFSTGAKITLFVGQGVDVDHIAEVTVKKLEAQEYFDLTEILAEIGADGVHDLWVEAGGRCFSALVEGHLVNQAMVYVAPCTIGADAIEGFVTKTNLFADVKQIKWYNFDSEQICEMKW